MTPPLSHERQLINILTEISQTGSVSQTAANLFMTQPTVSKLIRNQEKQYGVALIDRAQHPLRLTYAGEYYLRQMQQLVRSFQTVSNNLKAYAHTDVGRITLGVNPSLAQVILPQLLPEFHRRFPQVQIHLFEQPAVAMAQAVLAGDIDMHIGIGRTYDEALEHQRLFTDSAALIMPSRLLPPDFDANATPGIATLIHDQDFIAETDDSGFQHLVTSFLAQNEATPNIILRTPNLTTAVQLANAGLGATIVPASLLTATTLQGDTQIVPLPVTDFQADVAITYKVGMPLSEPVQEFLTLAQATFDPTKMP
ncbi:LysR family transcriptional regulator [Lacticaseibacillus thailandensis]|uniref:Lysr family transcriptional regulator n=1 Tax=Lacticaseibacillus thailandensis DSM 22698 = JCM 13996 TaxID=1423810 RepID=A0A0R2C850_9LACO|nr:LysR family transcriptional regulator [Lacticaseibacillus thailandensis]KRM87504.1 lysr family transcriptional regulator [Lacticaseibacillus thailandensis DSM 22698 = JCM 13996]